ncbi:MAG: NTPase [Planctomycetota bacterium]|jgi:nucleoside-triphosphatase
MSPKAVKILLTGMPGCGKTTAVAKIVAGLKDANPAGFYTEEIRQNNTRKGFRWATLAGDTGILAHVDIKSPFKVGRYGVDVAGFEKSVLPALDAEATNADLFVIDEIGKMECFSKKFVTAVRRLLASDASVLATVARKGTGFIDAVKNYPGTKLYNLKPETRDKAVDDILQILASLKKPSPPGRR